MANEKDLKTFKYLFVIMAALCSLCVALLHLSAIKHRALQKKIYNAEMYCISHNKTKFCEELIAEEN